MGSTSVTHDEEFDELQAMADRIPSTGIPPQFLDPITCTIMLRPVTLPSGKVIDAQTSMYPFSFLSNI